MNHFRADSMIPILLCYGKIIQIDEFFDQKNYFKAMSIKSIVDLLKKETENASSRRQMRYCEGHIGSGDGVVAILQPKHRRYVTFENKSYHIEFPDCLYVIYHDALSISSIEAYACKKWEGLRTDLFEYPFPNMLSQNKICIGSADKHIQDGNIVAALENIIFTQYSHSSFNGIKGFKNTRDWFEYLEKNPFPEDLMICLNKKARSLFEMS